MEGLPDDEKRSNPRSIIWDRMPNGGEAVLVIRVGGGEDGRPNRGVMLEAEGEGRLALGLSEALGRGELLTRTVGGADNLDGIDTGGRARELDEPKVTVRPLGALGRLGRVASVRERV